MPIIISDEWLAAIKARQPELRTEKLIRYKKDFDIPDYDAQIITSAKKLADIFEGYHGNLQEAEEGIQLADGRDHATDERARDGS